MGKQKTFADELKRLRVANGLTQKELADKVGKSQGFIGQLETGARQGRDANLQNLLCEALGVSKDHWVEYFSPDVKVPPPPAPSRIAYVEGYAIPLLGTVGAGYGDDPELFVPEREATFAARYGPDCFALVVKGQSCQAAGIPNGAIVVIDPHIAPREGDIVVISSDEGYMMKIYLDGKLCEFRPGQDAPKPVRAKRVELKGVVIFAEVTRPRFIA